MLLLFYNVLADIQKQEANKELEQKQKRKSLLGIGFNEVDYKGCTISKETLRKLEAKEVVLLVAFGRKYIVVESNNLSNREVEEKCKNILLGRLQLKNQGSTKYRIVY